jgi:hypothetical protein
MAISDSLRVRAVADVVGAMASGLCALHCLAVPVTLVLGSLGPLIFITDEGFHEVLIWLVVPTAGLAFSAGCLQHRDRVVFLLGGVGLVLLLASFTVVNEITGEVGERVMTVFAASLLIAAHVRNFGLCRRVACVHPPS